MEDAARNSFVFSCKESVNALAKIDISDPPVLSATGSFPPLVIATFAFLANSLSKENL